MNFSFIFSGRFVFLLSIWVVLCSMVVFRGTYTSFIQFKPVPDWGISPDTATVVFPVRPDFSKITDVNRKKEAFFNYLSPYIEDANNQVLQIRSNLLEIEKAVKKGDLEPKDKQYLNTLASIYRCPKYIVGELAIIHDLLRRIDVVPVSLALAQAANETAWGTSRFAVKGNNYFGIWCFKKGCGIVPNKRNGGDAHEVAKFANPAESASYYIKQLNSHNNYQLLRELRAKARRTDSKVISGSVLADGLENYSAIGLDYVASIRSIIRVNKLQRFDYLIE